MAGGSRAATTHAQSPGLQQALRQLVADAEADIAFLATSSAQNVGKSFSIVAWHLPDGPPGGQRALLKARWIRSAVNRALESGRTTLTAGAWRATADHPRRARLLIAVPVFNTMSPTRGALALLLPSVEADLEVVVRLERSAREAVGDLTRAGPAPAPSSASVASLFRLPERRNHVLQHELRVPLGAACIALEALAMRHATGWEREDERLIQTAQFGLMEAQGVLRLANQMQTSGDLAAPSLRPVSPEKALEGARELFPAAPGRLRLDLSDDLPSVWADALWLTQALTNLVENALKYSWPHTPITMAARPWGSDRVLISVQSFGEAFPDDQRQILEHDGRGDALPVNPAGGGLGLSIVRRFITEMGGEIWVERGEHGATKVTLSLPGAFA